MSLSFGSVSSSKWFYTHIYDSKWVLLRDTGVKKAMITHEFRCVVFVVQKRFLDNNTYNCVFFFVLIQSNNSLFILLRIVIMLHAMSSDELKVFGTKFTYTLVYEEIQLSLFKLKRSVVRTRSNTYRVYKKLDNGHP